MQYVSKQEVVDIVAACASVEDGCRAVSVLQAHMHVCECAVQGE